MSIEIVLWRSKGSETLRVSSIFDFEVVKSGKTALFIVLLSFYEGLENEVVLQSEEML